jgi:hypothetical protein
MAGTSPVRDNDGNIQEHVFQIGDMAAAAPGVADPEPSPPPASAPQKRAAQAVRPPAQPAAPAAAPSQQLSTRQIVAQLKARLRVVEREIKTRRALEKERDQIKRLIAAALTEHDNVRRLRSAG